MSNKVVFKVEGDDKEYCVIRPDSDVVRQADAIYAREWKSAAESKNYMLRARLWDILRDNGLWNDEKEKLYRELQTRVRQNEKKIISGGIKKSDARKIALDIRSDRASIQELLLSRNQYDQMTVESQAEEERFRFYCSRCICDGKTGAPLFKDLSDYKAKSDTPVAFKGAATLAEMLFGLTQEFEKKLPENVFLKKYGFINDKMQLVNKDGHLIDIDGRLINDEGRYVTASGELCDASGNLVDEEGQFVVQTQPFLDDEGNPLAEEATQAEAQLMSE